MSQSLTIAQEPRGIPGTEWIFAFDGSFSLANKVSRLSDYEHIFVLDLGRTHAWRHVLREILGRVTATQSVSLVHDTVNGITGERLAATVHELFADEFTYPTGLGNESGMLTVQRQSSAPRWYTDAPTGLSVCVVPRADIALHRDEWHRAFVHMVKVLPTDSWELLTDSTTASMIPTSLQVPLRVVESTQPPAHRGARKNQLARAARFSECLFLSVPVELPPDFYVTLAAYARGLSVATPRLHTMTGQRAVDWIAVQAESAIDGHTALLDYRATSRWALTGGDVLLARSSVIASHPFIDCLDAGADHELVRRLQRHGIDPVCLPIHATVLVEDSATLLVLPYNIDVEFAPTPPPSHGVMTVHTVPSTALIDW